MKESELKALISLLEDDDPEIQGHIQGKLVSLGNEVIPVLESAWEEEANLGIQEAIEEVIYTIQSEQAIKKLSGWMHEPTPSLLDGWLHLTHFQYPELDPGVIRKQINRLVNRTWLELRTGMTIKEKIVVLNRMLFGRERFRSNRKNLSDPQNFFINGFLDTRKGAPISLGMLYLIMCRELEIQMSGLVLPGYFVLVNRQSDTEIFIDVFNKGGLFERKHLETYLKEMNLAPDEKYYQPASNQRIILALIRSLQMAYTRRKEDAKIKEMQRLLDRLG